MITISTKRSRSFTVNKIFDFAGSITEHDTDHSIELDFVRLDMPDLICLTSLYFTIIYLTELLLYFEKSNNRLAAEHDY